MFLARRRLGFSDRQDTYTAKSERRTPTMSVGSSFLHRREKPLKNDRGIEDVKTLVDSQRQIGSDRASHCRTHDPRSGYDILEKS